MKLISTFRSSQNALFGPLPSESWAFALFLFRSSALTDPCRSRLLAPWPHFLWPFSSLPSLPSSLPSLPSFFFFTLLSPFFSFDLLNVLLRLLLLRFFIARLDFFYTWSWRFWLLSLLSVSIPHWGVMHQFTSPLPPPSKTKSGYRKSQDVEPGRARTLDCLTLLLRAPALSTPNSLTRS